MSLVLYPGGTDIVGLASLDATSSWGHPFRGECPAFPARNSLPVQTGANPGAVAGSLGAGRWDQIGAGRRSATHHSRPCAVHSPGNRANGPLTLAYPPGPKTVSSIDLDSILPSPVQMAPVALQSVVTGKTSLTSPLEPGSTVIRQGMLLGLPIHCALVTCTPVKLNAWSRRVL